jgi:hypothetical protein
MIECIARVEIDLATFFFGGLDGFDTTVHAIGEEAVGGRANRCGSARAVDDREYLRCSAGKHETWGSCRVRGNQWTSGVIDQFDRWAELYSGSDLGYFLY